MTNSFSPISAIPRCAELLESEAILAVGCVWCHPGVDVYRRNEEYKSAEVYYGGVLQSQSGKSLPMDK